MLTSVQESQAVHQSNEARTIVEPHAEELESLIHSFSGASTLGAAEQI